MIKLCFGITIATICIVLPAMAKDSAWNQPVLKYCVPVARIELNPFREIRDGKDLAYLMLLKSYISRDAGQDGLLSKYEFSPDGKTFTAEVSANAFWPDGSRLKSTEAAEGIARGLLFRAIGQRVEVSGARMAKSGDWVSGHIEGVTILSPSMFQLKFASKIDNLTGIVREALSTNSRHNRVWPVKKTNGFDQVIGKHSIKNRLHGPVIQFGTQLILIAAKQDCSTFDFSIYPEASDESKTSFIQTRGPEPQSISLELNTSTLDLSTRSSLIAWVRGAFSYRQSSIEIESAKSFFLRGEAGYVPEFTWTDKPNLESLRRKKIKIGYLIPALANIVKQAAARDHLSIELLDLTGADKPTDARMQSSGMENGRQVVLQDILETPTALEYLKNAPLTLKSLRDIQLKSASTVPPDATTLKTFESNAMAESSMAPLARRYVVTYSRQQLPFQLIWQDTGELDFISRAGSGK